MRTGSSHSAKRKSVSRPGGGSITRVALTERCRIERQRNLPRGSQRIISASLGSPLEILPRPGTEIAGRPLPVQSNIHPGPNLPGQVRKSYKEGEPITLEGAVLTDHQLVVVYHAERSANQSEKEQEGAPQHWFTIELTDLTKDPRPAVYVYPEYSYPTTDPLTSNAMIQAKVVIVPAFSAENKEGCVEEGKRTDNCLVFRKQLLCYKDRLEES